MNLRNTERVKVCLLNNVMIRLVLNHSLYNRQLA